MAVAYVTFNIYNGTSPFTSDPYSPTGGDQIYILGFSNSVLTFSMSGSATTLTNQLVSGQANFSDGNGDTYSLWSNLTCSGTVNQTFTVATSPSAQNVYTTYQLEFSGGVSTKLPVYTTTASPGVGAGGVLGSTAAVAVGDILVAICINSDVFGPAATDNTGTSNPITEYGSTVGVYWNGTGGSITPSFTAATGEGGSPHQVVQWVVSATGGIIPPPPVLAFGPMPKQLYVMP